MDDPPTSSEPADAVRSYTFKPSLAGGVRQFDLTEAGLAWQIGGRRDVWPYGSIAAVRLTYRPISMQPYRFRADVIQDSGKRVVLLSTTWKGLAAASAQDDAYRAFVVGLHRRLADRAGRVTFSGGLRPSLYALAVGMLGLLALAMFALLVQAVMTGATAGALFLLAMAALFGWQIGGFMRRNRPCIYTPDDIPARLIP